MKQTEKILPFEHLIGAYIVSDYAQSGASTADREAAQVFSAKLEVSMPTDRVQNLLNALGNAISKATLGSLVTASLADKQVADEVIHEKTGLTPSILDSIKQDMAFTNSIPVKSLVKLLKFLAIPFDQIISGMEQTFDKLNVESRMLLAVPASARPSFRKGVQRGDLGAELLHLKADESYLYQNKEAMDKYVKRFTELYEEIA